MDGPQRVLLTGAGGLLATELEIALPRAGHEVVARSHDQLDVADGAAVRRALERFEPQVVVNAAAWSDVDAAETRPDLAERANALGPEQLAVACAQRGVFLVHYSTDYVFEGLGSRPYREDDPAGPVNAYARTKLEGERRVARVLPGRHLVVRVAWLYGARGRSFLRTVLRAARDRAILEVVDDQWGDPTWAADAATATSALLEVEASGVVHVASRDHTHKHEFATVAVELASRQRELKVREIRAVPSAARPDVALRPGWTTLDTSLCSRLTGRQLPAWRDSLEAFLDHHLDELLERE